MPKKIAFNVIPQIDVFTENGYTKEEMKMLNETRKIMHDPDIDAKSILSKAKGVILYEDYPIPLDVAGRDEVFVGRIRKNLVFEPGISMWITANNVRKGAATNALQIAELLTQFAMV